MRERRCHAPGNLGRRRFRAAAFFLAATWGAGQSMMPLSGAPLGSAVQEAAIAAVSYSSAPMGIIAFALILWGLRTPSNRAAPNAR